jgi:murein L,D-transpeptidase YafK
MVRPLLAFGPAWHDPLPGLLLYDCVALHEAALIVGKVEQALLSRGVWVRTAAAAAVLGLAIGPAQAFRVELKDVAPDRIERQRAEAVGQIPFPGTPNIAQFEQRLKEKGLAVGSAVFIRVFKAESELEVWMQKGDRFELFATYPICHWSGTLGPKVNEGDKQSPEGVYTVPLRQLHMIGRHPRTLNLGFPNALDKQFQRTGSYILIHGGCGSVGCFAMTNPVIEEIFSLSQAALRSGNQDAIQVNVFPFRMTEPKLRAYAMHEWYDFWRNLKDVHDAFERTKRPPKVTVCEGRYWVEPDEGNGEVASQSPLAVCEAPLVASLSNPTVSAPWPTVLNYNPQLKGRQALSPQFNATVAPIQRSPANRLLAGRSVVPTPNNPLSPSPNLSGRTRQMQIACVSSLPSCRKWIAQQTAMAERRLEASRTIAQLPLTARPRR